MFAVEELINPQYYDAVVNDRYHEFFFTLTHKRIRVSACPWE
jgi:hypothetical protein